MSLNRKEGVAGFNSDSDDTDKVVCPKCGNVMDGPDPGVSHFKCGWCGSTISNPYYKSPWSVIWKWLIGIIIFTGIMAGIQECKNANNGFENKSTQNRMTSTSNVAPYSGNTSSECQSTNIVTSPSNTIYPEGKEADGNSKVGSYSKENNPSKLKEQGAEMVWSKSSSPGYYKLKGNYVIELWDDGTVAATYKAIGTYKSMAEFRRAVGSFSFNNPFRSSGELNRCQAIMLFGPVNEDYDEYAETMYDVYGIIMIINNQFEYYENTLGNSDVFTFIQKLDLLKY